MGIDGREYARLVNISDRTEIKTVVVNALADPRLFTPKRVSSTAEADLD
ncbi:hypothetical protein [Aliidongia dinghuensis]|nr:hypothetical protein [Aliidongia dinghuensis]